MSELEDAADTYIPNYLRLYSESKGSRASQLALSVENQPVTWGELYQQASRLARQLTALGLAPGSRIAVLMGNNRAFVELVHASMQLEAAFVPLNLRLTADEVGWQLADVQADVLVYDEPRAVLALEAAKDLPHLDCLSFFELAHGLEAEYQASDFFKASSIQTIIYSSGTTGRPKGVLLTYGNHFANAQASRVNLAAGPADCWLAVLPLFHVGGLAIVLRGLFYQMPVVVQESFDPAGVNRALDEEGVTLVSVVATMLARMLDQRDERPYPSSLRAILIGGGPVPAPLLERCARLNIPVVQTYGMTETASQAATLAPADALRKLGSAGKPLPGVELRLESSEAVVGLAEGGVGEIVLRGPIVTPGYDNRPTQTAQAWRGGWFHTGDLGRLDDEGFLYVVDRRDDLIISGGENVYPAEVEAVLLAHPAIEEAGVVGRAEARWGQVAVAFVKCRPQQNLTEAEVIAHCRERLARYKVPVSVYFVEESLPRNAAGKLLRRVLRERL